MQRFTIGEAWSQMIAFFAAHWQLLLLLVGGATLIGNAVTVFVLGVNPEQFGQQLAAASTPMAMQAFLMEKLPALLAAILLAGILTSTAQFAALRLGLLPGREDVGSAVGYGVGAAVLYLLLWMVVGFAATLILGLIFGLLGAGAMFTGGGSAASAAGTIGIIVLLLLVVVLPLMLWLSARLSVAAPAMAEARSINPLYGLAQSWRLTRDDQWPIVGFILVMLVALIVVAMVLGVIAGGIGLIVGGTTGSFISSTLSGIPQGMISVAFSAGIYRALVPYGRAETFA
ncbi:MAG: hypothetical protein MUF41_03185 [Sphingopyxis sp.]|nr:hypothetical protein [Sphingopyxis sp.]